MANFIREDESFVYPDGEEYIKFEEVGEITEDRCPIDVVAKFKTDYSSDYPVTDAYPFSGATVLLNWKAVDNYSDLGFYFQTKLWTYPEVELGGYYDYHYYNAEEFTGELVKDQYYYVRLYLPDFSSPCQIKVWPVGEVEPDEWFLIEPQVDVYPGYIGYGVGYNEFLTSAEFDYITVGTKGDIPDSPDITFADPVISTVNPVEMNLKLARAIISGNMEMDTYIHEKFPPHLSGYNKFLKANHKRAMKKQRLVKRPKRGD